jgi:quercetin dioxygenase-like cupin family protein
MTVMTPRRIFPSAAFMTPADDEPARSVVVETPEAVVVAWYVQPGQRIPAHVHPAGQDTWTVLSGHGLYQTDAEGATRPLKPGDIAIAGPGSVHGVYNHGNEVLQFISVVTPASAGYERLPAPN